MTTPAPPACANPALNVPVSLGSATIDAAITVAATFDGTHVFVASTRPYDPHTEASTVLLSAVDCTASTLIDAVEISGASVSNTGLTMASDDQGFLLAWNVTDSDGVTVPHTRPFRFDLRDDGSGDQPLALSYGGAPVQGDVRSSTLVPVAGGGYYLTGSFTPAGASCPDPFIQKLKADGTPDGELVDIYAGGLGRCATGDVPLTVSPDGPLYLAWLATHPLGTTSTPSVNNLSVPMSLLDTVTPQIRQVPSSQGVEPTDLSRLSMASGLNSSLTAGIASAYAATPWTPQYLVFSNRPDGATNDAIIVTDTAQTAVTPSPLLLRIIGGAVEHPIIVPAASGGTLGWTLIPPLNSGAHAAMFARRFAYDGLHWSEANLLRLIDDGAPVERHLEALVPVSETVFFMVWAEGIRGQLHLYGQFASF